MTNDEIAENTFVSINTIKTHIRHIFSKLGVTDRDEAIRKSRELEGFCPPENHPEDCPENHPYGMMPSSFRWDIPNRVGSCWNKRIPRWTGMSRIK